MNHEENVGIENRESILNGTLIDSEISKKWLIGIVNNNSVSLDFCAAFITINSLKFFYESFLENGFNGSLRLLARWQLGDLLSGASDFASYEYARKNGIKFFVHQEFHGKIYAVNPGGVLIGSANLTSAGFGLKSNGNEEVCVTVNQSKSNSDFLENLFRNAVEIDEFKFNLMKKAIEDIKDINKNNNNLDWPENILKLFENEDRIESLMVDEMFHSDYTEANSEAIKSINFKHDMSLLGLTNKDLNNSLIKGRFLQTRAFLWLKQKLNERQGGEIYFGELTKEMHSVLVDDPVPYRKNVKVLLQNLLDWSEIFAKDQLVIDRPNYSQRIKKIL